MLLALATLTAPGTTLAEPVSPALTLHSITLSDSGRKQLEAALDQGIKDEGLSLVLTANGVEYPLQLWTPATVGNNSSQQDVADFLQLHGRMTADPESWVRLAVWRGRQEQLILSGHMQAYGTQWQIDSASNPALTGAVGNVMFDASSGWNSILTRSHGNTSGADLRTRDGRIQGASDYLLAPPANLQQPVDNWFNTSSFADLLNRATNRTPVRAVRIGIVVDSRFDEYHGGDGLQRARSIVNSMDGIYREQLGVAVIAEDIVDYTDPATDPMRDTVGSIDNILGQFRQQRIADGDVQADLSLVHLFTGLEDPDGIIGLGWIGTACRTDGYDVSVSTPFPFDTLLAAHEIAHNLGALHDDDPACSGESTSIMWPRLSSRTTGVFSNCSREQVQQGVAAGCNLDVIDLAIGLQATALEGLARRQLTVVVRNNDHSRTARNVEAELQIPGNLRVEAMPGRCTRNSNEIRCNLGDLPAGSNSSFSFDTIMSGTAIVPVLARTNQTTAIDISQLNNQVVVDVRNSNGIALVLNQEDGTTAGQPQVPSNSGASAGTGTSMLWLLLLPGLMWRLWDGVRTAPQLRHKAH